jgi:Resolvase, N terminal domain
VPTTLKTLVRPEQELPTSPWQVVEPLTAGQDRRPQLVAALKAAQKAKAAVVVGKLDRLSRDMHFISGLMGQAC